MRIGKGVATAVVVLVLSAQAYAVAAGTGWYWPFMDYPMYSPSFEAGDRFRQAEIRVAPCRPGATARRVSWMELRRGYFDHLELAEQAAGTRHGEPITTSARDSARRELSARIRKHLADDPCVAEVWVRTYTIGPGGLEETEVPWVLEGRWPVAGTP